LYTNHSLKFPSAYFPEQVRDSKYRNPKLVSVNLRGIQNFKIFTKKENWEFKVGISIILKIHRSGNLMKHLNTMLNQNTFISLKILEALMQKGLSEEDKAKIIAEGFAELEVRYPDLANVSTKDELKNSELRLTKEIKELDVKIKDLDVKLTKEIKEVEAKLTKEIKEVDAKIKDLDVKLTKEIKELDVKIKELDVKLTTEIKDSKVEIIKWVSGMLFVQVVAIAGLFFTAIKLISNQG